MKKSKWGYAGRGFISRRKHTAISKEGGQARAKKLSRRKLSAIGKKGGRPGTVRARAKQLGVKIPRGASRQYASKLVQKAEAALTKKLRRSAHE
jgi:hypothetical protein